MPDPRPTVTKAPATVADPAPTGRAEVVRARNAVFVAFIASGFAFASWASRIPQVRDHLRVSPGTLGLILFSIAVGSILALPLSGLVVARFGEARTVTACALVLGTGLVVVSIGYSVGVPVVAVGLFLLGLGNGAWDVAMNVQGADVERRLGKSIMSRFHAGYSVGTVAGAGLGAGAAALDVPVPLHLSVVAGLVVLAVPLSVLRGFLPHIAAAAHESRQAVAAAWREPRTLLIGLFVLCMAFAEGSGNDWLSVGVVDGYDVSKSVGAATLTLFLVAMTLGRWFGPGLLDRYGRVLVLRACAITALVGLVLVVYGQVFPLALVGTLLLGVGVSLGFPTGISAAADDPAKASARVSVASSIAYCAFLGGPPVIGFVADHVGTLRSLTVVAVLVLVAVFFCGACRPAGERTGG